jgi:sarcosine oxidase, subunit gamma
MADASIIGETDDAFAIAPLPATGRFVLRGGVDAADPAGAALGLSLPRKPHATSVASQRAALWLGPDEWLLLVPQADVPAVMDGLAAALSGIGHSLVEVSDRQVGLRLSGRLAARVLSSGCPLDLGDKAFPVGMATRTLFHKAEIVLWRQADSYRVEVWRSFLPYVLGHLEEARKGARGLLA